MKLPQLLLSLVIICVVTALTFVGVSAYTEGDAQPTLLLFVGVISGVITPIVSLVRSQKSLDVGRDTNRKVDEILNGSVQGKISALEQRMSNVEKSLIEILAKLS